MAQSYCKPDLPSDRLGDRYWIIGVFAATRGKPEDASKFFGMAIKKKPSYKDELAVFPEIPAPSAWQAKRRRSGHCARRLRFSG